MKGFIDISGVLHIYRAGKPIRTKCKNSDYSYTPCSYHCPLFGNPMDYVEMDGKEYKKLSLCENTILFFDDFTIFTENSTNH